ncbi:hypothetical protein BDB01DRAFT_781200 [Pilobolus umbonatus]|nr:hypothetical protein BDB01DRAFT_781200 [Pilobolus umbonatus]
MSSPINHINIKNIKNINIKSNELKRAPSSETTSSTSLDSGVKKRRDLNYLCGLADIKWDPQSKLTIQGIDITSVLKDYRLRNIKLAKKYKNLSDMKWLSLSYIFPINNVDKSKCIIKLFKEKEGIIIIYHLYKGIQINRASSEAFIFCKDMSYRGKKINGLEYLE